MIKAKRISNKGRGERGERAQNSAQEELAIGNGHLSRKCICRSEEKKYI